MPEDSGQEKTEQATQKKRTEARKHGTVARSQDLTNAAAMLGMILVLPSAASTLGTGLIRGMQASFGHLPTDLSHATLMNRSMVVLGPALPGLAFIMATGIGIALVSNFAQVGIVLSPQTMIPSFGKINPVQGIKRMVSTTAIFEALKVLAKTVLFGFLAFSVIAGAWPAIATMPGMPPLVSMAFAGGLLRTVAIRIAAVWFALSAMDYYVQRKRIDKQLRMTKEEVRREMKDAEASPEMKAARMRRRNRMRRARLMDAMKLADVVVTNPTHFAVAIQYDPQKHHAPIVVAKGQDFLAAKIREYAVTLRVPIVPNPPLARTLYRKCEVGDFVPRELFQAVAEVLAYVYKTLKKVRPKLPPV